MARPVSGLPPMGDFITSHRRKAARAKTIEQLHQICVELLNAGCHEAANKYFTSNLARFGWPKPKPKPKGKVGRKGGLPQESDYEIIRLRQQGLTQRAAGEIVWPIEARGRDDRGGDYHAIENRVRAIEARFFAALADPKRRKEYEKALRKQHGPDLYVTRWGILTGKEMREALDQGFREAPPL